MAKTSLLGNLEGLAVDAKLAPQLCGSVAALTRTLRLSE
jgi:hypothetical protein